MLSHSGPNQIVSSDGFSVRVLGRTGIEYQEEARIAFIDSEVLASPGMVIYKDSISGWRPPHEHEVIPNDKKVEILDRVVSCLHFGWPEAKISLT
jgi:hypothetical protein